MKRQCECGVFIGGATEKQVKSNTDKHRKSKRHKEIMKILRDKGVD